MTDTIFETLRCPLKVVYPYPPELIEGWLSSRDAQLRKIEVSLSSSYYKEEDFYCGDTIARATGLHYVDGVLYADIGFLDRPYGRVALDVVTHQDVELHLCWETDFMWLNDDDYQFTTFKPSFVLIIPTH